MVRALLFGDDIISFNGSRGKDGSLGQESSHSPRCFRLRECCKPTKQGEEGDGEKCIGGEEVAQGNEGS